MDVFKTDQGATYVIGEPNFDGTVTIVGNTGPNHNSEANRIVVTGKRRNQGRMGGAFPYSVGMGRRAILFFDTGEGVEQIRGVVLG